MFEVPTPHFVFYPSLWLTAILVGILLCVVSGLLPLLAILKLLPAQAMRPCSPKGGKRIFLERFGIFWRKISFNTRYTLKNALRNKGRFLAVTLGMCGSCALLAFSLGFYDSIANRQDKYFEEFANYDVIANFEPIPMDAQHLALKNMDNAQKALFLQVEVEDKDYRMVVTKRDFNGVNLPREALADGVILPEYYAKQWDVNVGDAITINNVNLGCSWNVNISAIIPQYLGLMLYTSYDYMEIIDTTMPAVYNGIYGRSENLDALTTYLKENEVDFATITDDQISF